MSQWRLEHLHNNLVLVFYNKKEHLQLNLKDQKRLDLALIKLLANLTSLLQHPKGLLLVKNLL